MTENSEENLRVSAFPRRRVAFYGGSFDPLHVGHLAIARALSKQFDLDKFVFIPAFHAPHKKDRKPTSGYHRFAMIALATNDLENIEVTRIELELPERPYTVETLSRLKNELPDAEIFFVMGADSWQDILTWREWETVLTLVNIIVVTRPDYEISFAHVTDEIRARVVDLRGNFNAKAQRRKDAKDLKIYFTDKVFVDVSATEIRHKIKENIDDWRKNVPDEVAKYIEKYELYKRLSA